MTISARLRSWAAQMKREALALWLAHADPRTPWHAKAAAMVVVAYALSPIDLIPDFIPVLGLVDDLILVPLGVALVVKLMPEGLMSELRQRAAVIVEKPSSPAGAVIVIVAWLIAGIVMWRLLGPYLGGDA